MEEDYQQPSEKAYLGHFVFFSIPKGLEIRWVPSLFSLMLRTMNAE